MKNISVDVLKAFFLLSLHVLHYWVVRKNPAISLPQGPGASTCHITSSTPTTCPNGKINLGFILFSTD